MGSRPSQSGRARKRLLAAAVFISAFGALYAYVSLTGRPELVYNSDKRPGGHLYKGHLFRWTTSGVEAISIVGGRRRVIPFLAQPGPGERFSTLEFEGGNAVYLIEPAAALSMAGGGGGGVSERRRNLGSFRWDPGRPLTSGETRIEHTSHTSTAPNPKPSRLHLVSLEDGIDRELKPDTLGLPLHDLWRTIAGADLYWIKENDRRIIFASTRSSFWTEFPMNADLMTSPLQGGPARKIASGIACGPGVQADQGGIWWRELRRFPDRRADLCYYAFGTGTLGRILEFYHSLDGRESDIALWNGHLYRLRYGARGEARALMEYKPEQSEPRTVLSFPGKYQIEPVSLTVQSSRLVLTFQRAHIAPYAKENDRHVSEKPEANRFVGVLDPGGSTPIGLIAGPIPSSQPILDGEYVYYQSNEVRKKLFDMLSPVNTERPVFSLYRVRLRPFEERQWLESSS